MQKVNSFSPIKLLFFILVGFVIYFLASKWVGVDQIRSVLENANPVYFVLAFIVEIFAYIGTGLLLYSIFTHLKERTLSFLNYFKLGTITVVAIHTLPISVFGEAAFNYYYLRKLKIPTGSILAMLVTRLIFSYTSFFVILGISLLAVPALGDVSLAGKIAALLVFVILVAGVIFARNLYKNFVRFKRIVGRLIDWMDKAKEKLLRRDRLSDSQQESVIKDIHQGFSPLDDPIDFIKKTAIASIYWLADIACLFLVLYSLGFYVVPFKLIIAYGIATTLGAISFIPGGIGVVEGALGLMLVNIGVPIDITVMGVIGYRLFSFWLMLPIGLISMLSLNKSAE